MPSSTPSSSRLGSPGPGQLSRMASQLPVYTLLLAVLSASLFDLMQDYVPLGASVAGHNALKPRGLVHDAASRRQLAFVTTAFPDALSSPALVPCSVPINGNLSVVFVASDDAPLTVCPPSQVMSHWQTPEFAAVVEEMTRSDDRSLSSAGSSRHAKTWVVKTAPVRGRVDGSRPLSGFDQTAPVSPGLLVRLLEGLKMPVWTRWIVVAVALAVCLEGSLLKGAAHELGLDLELDDKERLRSLRRSPKTEQREPVATPADEAKAKAPSRGTKSGEKTALPLPSGPRSQQELEQLVAEKRVSEMTDDEIVAMALRGKVHGHALEKTLDKDFTRAVRIRRMMLSQTNQATPASAARLHESKLPYQDYDYGRVFGACCENVIGYVPLPVGMAGPLLVDGHSHQVPMATTEGVLVASTSRGCKAINMGGGAVTVLTGDGMTRGPCVSFETLARAGAARAWLESETGQAVMREAFDATSGFARLQSLKTAMAGSSLYIRFKAATGDAMGMNMMSKGVESALQAMGRAGFGDMTVVSLSGNYCSDKKPSALNWIEGRGKSVVAEAVIPAAVVEGVLKTTVDALVELNTAKNLVGSAMAGSVGGFNAHAANIVAAVFLATGQDPAQVVESASCITTMKNLRGSLQISVSMPSLEVGTLGGGTILEPQSAMLDVLGVRGANPDSPGDNARRLARVIAATVLAGELSLCSALAAGHLVRAHMEHNRSSTPAAGSA